MYEKFRVHPRDLTTFISIPWRNSPNSSSCSAQNSHSLLGAQYGHCAKLKHHERVVLKADRKNIQK